jgi:nucleotide-binding universal stress UspA family protein
MASGKKWIIGLDLGERSTGALRFAAWMTRHSKAAGGERLVGVHVLEEAHLQAALRYHHLSELETNATTTARKAIAAAGASDVLQIVHVVEGHTAEVSLEAAAAFHHGHAIVIGRNAPRDSVNPLRLGRVARRLLRTLSLPTMVVPPDLVDPAPGPVLLACSVDDDAIEAALFARDFAERFGRELVLVHVTALPEHHSAQYLPPQTLAKIRAEHQAHGERELAEWAARNGFAQERRVVVQGGIADRLVATAGEQNAFAIVSGSRRLTMFERWLLASTGSELAAHAACPVIVVPPP